MGKKKKTEKDEVKGAFSYVNKDGSVGDAGVVDELLVNEDRIRRELIEAGVIKEINLPSITNEEKEEYLKKLERGELDSF